MTRFDLHVHSALSACAENVMTPRQILIRAQARGLTIIAVADHNASAQVETAVRLAADFGLDVVPAMEVASREEVHVLALFQTMEAVRDFQELVDHALPAEKNNPDFFGYQLVYDENDEIVDVDERLRQVGTSMSLEKMTAEIRQRQGVVIPSHVLRRKHSLTSQLGFIEPEQDFDALEVTVKQWRRQEYRVGSTLAGYPLITGSDAHFLEDVGRCSLELSGSVHSIEALIKAVKQQSRKTTGT